MKLNGETCSKMIVAGANELASHKQLVDAMNVFPVPDGDTGTNMSLTVLAASKEAQKYPNATIAEVTKHTASGALRGARGNSGVIVSQLFRGFAKGLENTTEATTKDLARACIEAVKTAYKAVMKPKEGTILTVAKACGEASERLATETEDIEVFLEGIIAYGHEVLEKTPDMLPVLKQAGVVDAGGRGLLYILEGCLKYIKGEEVGIVTEADRNQTKALESQITTFEGVDIDHQNITFGYCTEFFIQVKNASQRVVDGLQVYLDGIGDSVVCVHDEEIIKIHVHTDNPGLALEKAMTIGSLNGIKIDNMRDQHEEILKAQKAQEEKKKLEPKKEVGFISISAGKGFSDIFKSLGVDVVIEGGQTMNPSTEDILNAVEKIHAENVIVLPNNKNIILASEQAVQLCADKNIYVIPTTSVPEGITAMFCNAEEVSAKDMAKHMKEAIKPVTTVSMTYAVRDTNIDGKDIVSGNILGMVEDKIEIVGEELQQSTKETLKKAVTEDTEMICIYYGQDVDETQVKEIYDFAVEEYDQCDVEMNEGKQPLYAYIISVE